MSILFLYEMGFKPIFYLGSIYCAQKDMKCNLKEIFQSGMYCVQKYNSIV